MVEGLVEMEIEQQLHFRMNTQNKRVVLDEEQQSRGELPFMRAPPAAAVV